MVSTPAVVASEGGTLQPFGRWTPLILRELLRGASSFNDVHRGVPRMSRSLLSARFKKLELCGIVERRCGTTGVEYRLTEAGAALGPVVTQLGQWGRIQCSPANLGESWE